VLNTTTTYQPASQAAARPGRSESKLQQLLLTFGLTILFTSPSLFLQASEGTNAPPSTASATSTSFAPNNDQGGGGSGDSSPAPCSAEDVSLKDVLSRTKGISAMAAAEPGVNGAANPSVLVVLIDRSGNEHYSKVQVTGRRGNALLVADCLNRLAPGPYTIIATSREYLKHKTIFVPTP